MLHKETNSGVVGQIQMRAVGTELKKSDLAFAKHRCRVQD